VGAAELIVAATLSWAPPTGAEVEGPAPEPGEGELLAEPPSRDVDAIVEAAAQAAQDRAWLERNGQLVEEYVRQLDALADINAELDACAGAIQAELRMGLALAYLKHEGTCGEEGATAEAETADERELPMPVLECFEATGPSDCAERLLDEVAAFASRGQGGTKAPFSQAFGCPHAVAEMSVEQMFGSCMAEQYEQAVDRFEDSQGKGDGDEVKVWPIPRWASAVGLGAGAAMVITGAVLLGIDGKCPGGYDPVTEIDQCPSVYNTNVGGGVLVGVGSVVMLASGTILTITEIQRKKAGKTRESAMRRRIRRAEALTGFRLSLPRPRPLLRP
jgi:hypothetical protein